MPKTPIDYSKAVIYSIVCKTDETLLYIGSTTDFTKRKNRHKTVCNNEKTRGHNIPVYVMIRANGGWDSFDMKPVKEYNCDNKIQLVIEEERIRKDMNASLNSVRAYVSPEELKELQKKKYKDNKEQITEKNKKYYAKNAAKIAETGNKYREANSAKIAENDKKYREANAAKIAEKHKIYYKKYKEANAAKIAENGKKYYEANTARILEQKKQYDKDNAAKISERRKKRYQERKNAL